MNGKHGLGLGLSMCKIDIENLAGKVTVDSSKEEGTTYTINFKTTCLVIEIIGAARFLFAYQRDGSDEVTNKIKELTSRY